MKIKSLLLLAIIFYSFGAFAQSGELKRGVASYNKFNQVKEIGTPALGMKDLEAAKNSLEKASTNDRTSNLAETWAYLALVYADYALVDETPAAAEYQQKAVDAIAKAKAAEGNAEQEQNLAAASTILAEVELAAGVTAFEAQDFATAYQSFNKGLQYLPGDTLFSYYAGLAAINAKDYPNAIEKYKLLLAHDDFSTLPQIYLDLSRLYMISEDTVSAIKYAEDGAAKFPDHEQLVTQNIEVNLQAGNGEKIISSIAGQIERNPADARLQYYYGIALSSNNDEKAAKDAYVKAVELDPTFADAYVNLGVMLLDQGINVFREASKLPANQQQEYNARAKEGNALIEEAFPYLEKATEVAPTHTIAWQNLKTYYQLKENVEKVAEIEAKIQAL
jgi:tetratricopeptide (TPR) repeat protein